MNDTTAPARTGAGAAAARVAADDGRTTSYVAPATRHAGTSTFASSSAEVRSAGAGAGSSSGEEEAVP